MLYFAAPRLIGKAMIATPHQNLPAWSTSQKEESSHPAPLCRPLASRGVNAELRSALPTNRGTAFGGRHGRGRRLSLLSFKLSRRRSRSNRPRRKSPLAHPRGKGVLAAARSARRDLDLSCFCRSR